MEQRTVFEQALRARLPLIGAYTTDTVHLVEVVEYLAEDRPVQFIAKFEDTDTSQLRKNRVIVTESIDMDSDEVYIAAQEMSATIVLVNAEAEAPALSLAFNVGEIPVPAAMVANILKGWLSEAKVEKCLPLMHGLTLKDAKEVAALSCVLDKGITPNGINKARRMLGGAMRGVESINTDCPNYRPRKDLRLWVDFESQFLHEEVPAMYRPRGLLFDGPPGTGKTMASKYIAQRFGVPLYRLDLGHLMSKWQGESETNLRRALARIENESPAVMLLDEVEKVFKAGADADVTHRLLGYLLWWLQEHKAPIVTLMTTNDLEALPKELYRKGRIDKTINFKGMSAENARGFARYMHKYHAKHWQETGTAEDCLHDLGHLLVDGVTHAELDNAVIGWIKQINS